MLREFGEELGVNLHLKYTDPAEGSFHRIPSQCVEEKLERAVRELERQGNLLLERKSDSQLFKNGCFSWLSKWRSCPSCTIAGAFEMYEQLLPTKLLLLAKRHTRAVLGM